MKFSLSIAFYLLFQISFGQITYKPVFINQCTQKAEEGVIWYLSDSVTAYGLNDFEATQTLVPTSGIYQLHINLDDGFEIRIPNHKTVVDTILLKRLEVAVYVSNPPRSEYFDCGISANGKVVDLYSNGNKRAAGFFEKGQPSDTLFSYYRNGKVSEIFIPKKKWKEFTYFSTGQLKSEHDTKKRLSKEYYPNGQLKKEEKWFRRHYSDTKEYYENGTLKMSLNHKERKRFNKKGILLERIKKKEIRVLERLFTFNKYDRGTRYYKYTWEHYNSNGGIQRKIFFSRYESFPLGTFPDSIQQISEISFDRVMLYQNGREHQKIKSDFVLEKEQYVTKFLLFQKEGKRWVFKKEVNPESIYDYILKFNHSKK